MLKLFQVIILFATIAFVYSDCRYSVDVQRKPLFAKKFGSRKVLLTKDTGPVLFIRTGEIIDAFCENGFWHGCNQHISSSHIELKCSQNSYIYYSLTGFDSENQLNDGCSDILKCTDSSDVQLFESNRSLPNCEPNMSLGVGIQVNYYMPIIYAGICYDWNNMNPLYVNYMAYRSKKGFLTPTYAKNTLQINSVTLDDKLDQIQDYFNINSPSESILVQLNFESDSLVQDLPLKDELNSFEYLLQIVWWRNLRLANWRTFLNLLEERSRDVPYNVFTGSSGEVTMPALDIECHVNKTLSYASSDNQRKAVPAFIWSYLKSTHSNITEDLVVIAYNSPFYYNDLSVYLCEDICDEFEWLSSFHTVRKMATLGLIYCCRPEDVAHKLNNFPHAIEEIEFVTTKQASINGLIPAYKTYPFPAFENDVDDNDVDDNDHDDEDYEQNYL